MKSKYFLKTTLVALFFSLVILAAYIPNGYRSILSYLLLTIIFCFTFSPAFIYKKLKNKNIKINEKFFTILFAIVYFFLIFSYSLISGKFKYQDQVNYFQHNTQAICGGVVDKINNGKYKDAINEVNSYTYIHDSNLINYKKIAEDRQAILEKNAAIKQQQIEKENQEKALEASVEADKKVHLQYLQDHKQSWLDIVSNDGKVNVDLNIKDLATAYSGLFELYPSNEHYKQRRDYWVEQNNEQIQHNKLLQDTFNNNIYHLEKYLKDNLNNPDSLNIVSENYYDQVDYISIEIKYRATNAYNAIITDIMTAKLI